MTEDRLRALEERLALIEDERAITRLIGCYGPLVDAADADAVAALWAENGTYDVEGWAMRGRADVHAMVLSDLHQGLVSAGCTHFLGPVVVTVDGDTAVAVCESVLVVHHESRFHVARSGANRFDLVRGARGWEILHRTTRALDGDPAARELLAVSADGSAR